jgi:hypothetical protein
LCCHHSMVRVASTTSDIVQYVFHAGQPPGKIFLWDDCLNVSPSSYTKSLFLLEAELCMWILIMTPMTAS